MFTDFFFLEGYQKASEFFWGWGWEPYLIWSLRENSSSFGGMASLSSSKTGISYISVNNWWKKSGKIPVTLCLFLMSHEAC